jgi:hypothetical protein
MFRHDDEIQLIDLRSADDLIEGSQAVTAEKGVNVNDAFDLFEPVFNGGHPLRGEGGDPLAQAQ